jgi:D-3-phosphoglycerate dehydrogenase
MRVLVADTLPDGALAELRQMGLEVELRPGLDQPTLLEAVRQAGVLIVRSTRVTAQVIEAATQLNLIVRAGAGVNTIDVNAASQRGIYVANCPGKNASAVAELTLGLILSLDRAIPDATAALRGGHWDKARFGKAKGLMGRAIGIAGLGAIGMEVLARARAFGLVPHAWSRSLTPERASGLGVGYASSLDQLASRVDILTLHLPLTPATRAIVNRDVLQMMREGAVLINTARSELVDEAAVVEVATKRKLRIGLDVFEGEPPTPRGTVSSPLLALDQVYATPHIGASTSQAQEATAQETVRIVRCFVTEGHVPNVVNLSATSPATCQLVVRHLDRVGVLANVLSVIKVHQINVEELTNTIFDGAHAACAKIRLSGRPPDTCLDELRAIEDVLHVDLVPLLRLA